MRHRTRSIYLKGSNYNVTIMNIQPRVRWYFVKTQKDGKRLYSFFFFTFSTRPSDTQRYIYKYYRNLYHFWYYCLKTRLQKPSRNRPFFQKKKNRYRVPRIIITFCVPSISLFHNCSLNYSFIYIIRRIKRIQILKKE